MGGKYNATGTFTNKGYFYDTQNWAETQEFMGFGTFPDRTTDDKLKLKLSCQVSLETGVKWNASKTFYIYTGLFFDYGLNSMVPKEDAQPFATHQIDGFSGDFTQQSILNSSHSDGNFAKRVVPMCVGLRVAFSFGM